MKTLVGKISVVAAVVLLVPLASVAQNIASQPGLVNRGVERLTLLPGPNLLSPARNVPSMAPARIKLVDTQPFNILPFDGTFQGGGYSLHLPLFTGSNPSGQPVIRAVPGPAPVRSGPPDLLRFDHTMEPPPAEFRWQFQPGAKRI